MFQSNINPNLKGLLYSKADVSCAATATTLVQSASSNVCGVFISNLAANATVIRVGDSSTGAARGTEIPVGASGFFDTTGSLYVYNPTGGAINIGVTYITVYI